MTDDFGRSPAGRPRGRTHVALDLVIIALGIVNLHLFAALLSGR